jgi:hypothetical protein
MLPSSGGKGKLGSWSVGSFSHGVHLWTTGLTQSNPQLSPLPEDGDRHIHTDLLSETSFFQ